MAEFYMNLRLFEGGAAGAGAAPEAGTGEAGGEAAEVAQGVLEDGTQVDARLAARMEEQAKRRARRGEKPALTAAKPQAEEQQTEAAPEEAEPNLDDEWTEIKKGRFKEQYGRDIQAAIQDRFKNQADVQKQLDDMQPMLQALMKKAGVENVEELSKLILDDDSLYEEEAEEAGMTVERYKEFKALQDEHDRHEQQERENQERAFWNEHFRKLTEQAEEMKKVFPDFDLQKEMQNETFRRMTMPNSGLTVEAAYYAIHHKELEPQAMAYGIQRAQQQISQSIQANRARPVEGALKNAQPADIAMDPRTMTREQRQKLIERARRGERIVI